MLNEITQTDIIASICTQEVQTDVPEFKTQGTEMVDFVKSTETQTTIAHVQSHEVQTDFLVESKEVQTFVSEIMTTESQTEWHFVEKSMQTEIEVTTEEKQNQTEKTNEDQSIQTEIDVTTEEKENQTEKTNEDQSIQTEIEVTTEEKENQTEKNNEDQSIQTEIDSHEKSNETEINRSNILTVNRIEVVEEMHSWGTQTDVSELESMDPITPVQCLVSTEYLEQLNVQVKENLSETDSVVSSASKLEISSAAKLQESQRQTTAAGLDMRMGEYHELDFPPVSSTNVALKHIDTVVKERTPSPEDLCTRCDVSPPKKKKKKLKISREKLPAACTISEDPRAVLWHVEKRMKTHINLTPAHKPPPAPSVSPKPRDMTSPVQLTGNGKSPHTEPSMPCKWDVKSPRTEQAMPSKRPENFSTSSGAIEALNCHEGLTSSNRQHQLRTSTPLRHSTLFAGASRNVFSSLESQWPLLHTRPTGRWDFSSPFRFRGWDKKLSAYKMPKQKDHELVSWNNSMLQMLPSKNQSRKRELEQCEESNTDSGIISDMEHASGEHTGTSNEASFNL